MKKHLQLSAPQAPEPIIRVILIGTSIVVGLMTLTLIASFLLLGNHYVLPRLLAAMIVLLYVAAIWRLYAREHFKAVSWMLLTFFAILGAAIVALWSINSAVGMLVLGFTIFLSGIILRARYILWTTIGLALLLIAIQALIEAGILSPDAHALSLQSTYLDVLSYCILFILFGVVAWLSGRRREELLHKSQAAEAALREEKALLNVRLEQKTREVREAQLEEMSQLYRFAELGQLGAVLLHDLANNLTALTLDIEDIGRRMQRNESITRAKESIAYLESMVNGVRRQINERDETVEFDVSRAVLESVAASGRKARRTGISIDYVPVGRPFMIKGDPIRFAHILTIIISNAIDASIEIEGAKTISIIAKIVGSTAVITVTDKGVGIPKRNRSDLFKPFKSNKTNGMGIGLFMAREMMVRHFSGTLELDPNLKVTTFVLKFPVSNNHLD